MDRRKALVSIVALGASPIFAQAQQSARMPRLCFLTFGPDSLASNRFGAFFAKLRQLGYVDGRTISIDYLSADGHADRYAGMVAECLRRKADVIASTTTPGAHAAKKATRTVPIVMVALGDPIGSGLVESLARPGGNVTGVSFMAVPLAAKRLEILKELMPRLSRVLVLAYPPDPISAPQVESMQAAARSLGITLLVRDIRSVADLPAAFEAGVKGRAEALVTSVVSLFSVHSARVVELATQYKLPAIFGTAPFLQTDALMTYLAEYAPMHEGAAQMVDKILKGANPADVPVEQATKFILAVNLKTAKALGLIVPPSLLARADRLIE